MKAQPEVPEVIVPHHRKVVASRRVGVRVLWVNLAEDQVADGVTTPFHADARAANPFESVPRALCLEAGLAVGPQAEVVLGRDAIHPDLVCRDRRTVVEGDSWTWHSTRKAHSWVLAQLVERVGRVEVAPPLARPA